MRLISKILEALDVIIISSFFFACGMFYGAYQAESVINQINRHDTNSTEFNESSIQAEKNKEIQEQTDKSKGAH